MKTIFDKIDPKYVECGTGVCEHTSHAHVLPVYLIAGSILMLYLIKTLKTKIYKHN